MNQRANNNLTKTYSQRPNHKPGSRDMHASGNAMVVEVSLQRKAAISGSLGAGRAVPAGARKLRAFSAPTGVKHAVANWLLQVTFTTAQA